MIAEIVVVPMDKWDSMSQEVAEVLAIIERRGIKYELFPMGTIVEGDVDELFDLFKEMHKYMRSKSKRVSTSIRIDDKVGHENLIQTKVASVKEKLAKISK